MLQKPKTLVSQLLRNSARGQECTIRLPGICNRDPATTVLCHLPGGGASIKHPDIFGAFGCLACHDEVDRRTRIGDAEYARASFFDGMVRTQQYWLDEGIFYEVFKEAR